MRLRSLLFVPGDSERKFARASQSGADALILDLEDAVAPSQKPAARTHVAGLVGAQSARPWALFVRVNALDTGMALDDLAAVVKPGLDALLIPKANGAADIERVGHYLDALEAKAGMTQGAVKLAVVATETPRAMFALGSYAPAHSRLVGLTWGAEDLGAAIGATNNKEPDGSWTFPYRLARAQCLFAERDCRESRRDGFSGRIAIHPDQIATINRCYAPSEAELEQARKIVAAFAANPDAGTLGIDGKMFDIPHLKAARRTLASA
jgi:citrate lyase subunit beta/citryl-CoA lyase